MPKNVKDMTNTELLESYQKGKVLTIQQEESENKGFNILGKLYDHTTFLAYLRRIEELEDEISRRNLWQTITN